MNSDENVLRLFRIEHVKGILEFIDQHSQSRVKDLEGIAPADTLRTSLCELVDLGCIKVVGAELERYELTKKGKTILQILKEMIQVVFSES